MSPAGQHTDVVFVVEGTALCGAYLHELRSQYIVPTLEYFSGPIDEKDCGSDSNYCLYGLVIFHAADVLPAPVVNTVGPLNTSFKLLNQIDRIRFSGGHGEAMSNVGEGLAIALECLEDLAEFRSTLTDVTAKKHIILICNCKPYGVPVSNSEGADEEYVGKTVEQLAVLMTEKEVHLSIMSPRKIPSLIQLFDHAGGDITHQKGYARDMRHLILLNGFSLKVNEERPVSPVRITAEAPLSTSQTMSINPSLSTNPQPQSITSAPPPTSIHLSVNVQPVPPVSAQNQQPTMLQLPRSPASSVTTSTGPLMQTLQQQSQIGVGGTSNTPQPNMAQLSQQQMMQLQQQQQQQMFQQQQQFRNPRPISAQAGNAMGNVRGGMVNPQQQMNQHLQVNQQQQTPGSGPQPLHQTFVRLQQQQQFQQQQQNTLQQAQLQNIALQQQQNAMQQNIMQQQNAGQQQNQMLQQQSIQQQQSALLQQQQQNQMQQNLIQQQAQIQQQNQNPMQMQASLQQNQIPVGQQNTMNQQQVPTSIGQPGLTQQGQTPLQQQQPGSIPIQQMSQGQIMQQRWPNQMTPQQQMQMAQQARMQMPNQNQPQPTSSPLQRPSQEILARLNQPPMATNPSPIQQQLGDGNPAQAQLQRERRIIWNGYLEWHEKQKGTPEGLKVPRQVPCQVSASVVNNEPEVKGDGWPSKLIMQLIPKQIVGNLGGNYFLDVKTVLFILQNCDALVSLTKVMDSGFAGCVHFTGSGMAPNSCTIKVLILLYSKERHAYLGFIPNDQAGFVDRIRKVIQQQKTQQAAIRQGTTGIPPSITPNFGPTPGQGGMQGGMVIQGQGPQHQQQHPVSVQQMPQPSMIPIQTTASQHQQQIVATPSQIPSSGPDSIELERQQNVLKIQQLKAQLEQAQRQELIYTQLRSQPTGQGSAPGQIMNPGQMGGQPQMGMSGDMNNQGQVQMGNQGQMTGMGNQVQMSNQNQLVMQQQGEILQTQGGMRQGMAPQRLQRPASQLNPGLKHLLQQPGANVGPPGAFRMRMQQNQMSQQQPQQQGQSAPFNEDLGILDLLK